MSYNIYMKYKSESGFLQIIVIVILTIVVLSLLGISFCDTSGSISLIWDNLKFVWDLITNSWDTIWGWAKTFFTWIWDMLVGLYAVTLEQTPTQ